MVSESGEVLFIDDEPHIRRSARQTLELADFQVTCLESADKALPLLSRDFTGVAVCDIRMPGLDGLSLLSEVHAVDHDLPIILITGHGDIAMAVGAMRDGAYDFLEKPYPPEILTGTVRRALEKRQLTLENRRLRQELDASSTLGPRLLGRTPAIKHLRTLIRQVANATTDVLIMGETGTGKEIVARSLHEQSERRGSNFVAVNCGALPEQLIESELFGHEAGAFTGARSRRIGKLEYSNGGTLFLDEIESMPLTLQVRLLRVLQERSIERVGGNESIAVDLRVVAAAKSDLREAADRGEFREDLYYRLNVITLNIRPLRERREDIPLLFQHFALVASARHRRDAPALSPDNHATLLAHDWPGNVRELRNAAERYVLLGEDVAFDLTQLMADSEQTGALKLHEQVGQFERSLIAQELRANHGNVSRAAVALGTPRKTLHDKMRKYGLRAGDFC